MRKPVGCYCKKQTRKRESRQPKPDADTLMHDRPLTNKHTALALFSKQNPISEAPDQYNCTACWYNDTACCQALACEPQTPAIKLCYQWFRSELRSTRH